MPDWGWIVGHSEAILRPALRIAIRIGPDKSAYRNVAFCLLQAQYAIRINLWQTCHEIGYESSKIVSLGAPFYQQRTRLRDGANRKY